MLAFKGPAQPSPTLGDALNGAGCNYLEVRCLGCDTHQTVALDIAARTVQRLCVQAQPSGRIADYEDFGERSTFDLVAG
jgi:hypothetical protein